MLIGLHTMSSFQTSMPIIHEARSMPYIHSLDNKLLAPRNCLIRWSRSLPYLPTMPAFFVLLVCKQKQTVRNAFEFFQNRKRPVAHAHAHNPVWLMFELIYPCHSSKIAPHAYRNHCTRRRRARTRT